MSDKRTKSIEQQLFEKEFIHNNEYRHKTESSKREYHRKPKNQREWEQWTTTEDDEIE